MSSPQRAGITRGIHAAMPANNNNSTQSGITPPGFAFPTGSSAPDKTSHEGFGYTVKMPSTLYFLCDLCGFLES